MTDQIDRPLEPRADTFSNVFARALRGSPCDVVGLDDEPYRLPMTSWTREADDACIGSTTPKDQSDNPASLLLALS